MKILQNKVQLLVAIVLLGYILVNIPTPDSLAVAMNSLVGHILVLLLAVFLILRTDPIVAALGIFALYELFRRGRHVDSLNDVELIVTEVSQDTDDEHRKLRKMKGMNGMSMIPTLDLSLEEKMIKKMVPLVASNDGSSASFKPVLDDNMNYSAL